MKKLVATFSLCLLGALQSQAGLIVFQNFVGNVGVSTAGMGTLAQAGSLTVNVPVGSTVLGAYVYSSTFSGMAGGTLNGNPLSYSLLGTAGYLSSFRADVTGVVKPVIEGGPGGAYSFNFTETYGGQDGTGLVVVYSNGALPISTVAILDGAQNQAGDTFTASFPSGLYPSASGFFAEMRLGIGFGYNPSGSAGTGQHSVIKVNGNTISAAAGNFDDGAGANGALFTIGDDNDPFTPHLPTNMQQDHERYNLAPYLVDGDTLIKIDTNNPSFDDIIFLAVFHITGEGSVGPGNPVPEPSTYALMAAGLAGLAFFRWRAAKS